MVRWDPSEKVLNVKNVGGLSLKWRHTIGSQVYSSPALVNGVVYVGSYNGNVYALTPAPALGCRTTPPARMGRILRPPCPKWRMEWCMSVRGTMTCTR
jgi:PQQ-like domain